MAGQYEKVEFLGTGGFGKVYLVRKKQDPEQLFAMKEISISKQSIGKTFQEVELLRDLDHPYILALKDDFMEDYTVYIITEYCPNGDLQQYISKTNNQPLKTSLVLRWFWQISSAVKYLHGEKVIHRDLKLENIFLDSNANCKLGDFGIARVLDCTLDMAQTQAGTPCYMSPEVIDGMPYNEKTDIWSLAIVIYELATLRKAFTADSIRALFNQITDGPIPPMPKNYSVEFQELLSSMMEINPAYRPSASDILRHLKTPPMQPQQMQVLMQQCVQTPFQPQSQPFMQQWVQAIPQQQVMPIMQPFMQPWPQQQLQPQMQKFMYPGYQPRM